MCKEIKQEFNVIPISSITKGFNKSCSLLIKDFIIGDMDNSFDDVIKLSIKFINSIMLGGRFNINLSDIESTGLDKYNLLLVLGHFYGWLNDSLTEVRQQLILLKNTKFHSVMKVDSNIIIFTKIED